MHQIQKLELVGFKSFCDRTQIVFNEGTTAIVGPNGCGKSNIADAISWVVGEQSAKSLRTDRMEGVIFNGTQARKATSLAEVVLTLSLMNEFNIPEGLQLNREGFTVGRRLYRSGESEYYLDGRRCRLKDIQALFEGTGLGPNSYALIEQGRIGQILSSKPADRRALIEEAARITLFKSRRYSAEMKLEMAQQNLVRVNDIIREVARQLNSLRRQAAKARRYNRMRDELRAVQRLKFALERRSVNEKLAACASRFAEAQAEESRIGAELDRLEQSRQAAQDAFRLEEERVSRLRDELAGLKMDAAAAHNLLQNQETQRTALGSRLRDIERDQQAVDERARIVASEQQRLTASIAALLDEIAREEETLAVEQAKGETVHASIREAERAIEDLRAALLHGAGQLADLRNVQARCQENLQRIAAQATRIEGERASKAQLRASLMAELDGFRSQEQSRAERQRVVLEQQAQSENRLKQVAAHLEAVTAELTARQEEYSRLQHRLSSLEEVERRRSNYSEGVQKFMSTVLPGEEAVSAQTLADLIETDPAYEAAVEDYLNDPLQYIMVDRLDDAVNNVDRLKKIGAGKCTFMTLRNGHPHGPDPERPAVRGDGVYGYLDELLHMSEEVRRAFDRALPDYAATVMVSDLPTAFRVAESHPGANYLTLSGEAYSPRGTLSAVGERKSMAGFLALKREKRDLQSRLASLRSKLQGNREEQERLKGEQSEVTEWLKNLSIEARKLELEGVVIGHQIERIEGELGKIDQTEKVTAAELSLLAQERGGLEAKLAEAAAGALDIEERSRSGNEQLRKEASRLEGLKSENADLTRSLAALASAHAVKAERRSGMESELRRLGTETEDVRKRSTDNGAEKEKILARLADLQLEQRDTEERITECSRIVKEAEADLEKAQKALALEREALAGSDGTLRALHAAREEALNARGKIEIEKTRLENDLEHLERSCAEEFHVPLSEVAEQIEEAELRRDASEVAAAYEELRTRIENFGAINMRALEEYQELDERYQFLDKQRTDIEQSIADTQKAIAEINRRSVEQFQDAFSHIRENFMQVFQILFRGGQCDLRLMDDGDVLESGIDIIAQPPGKRLQNVLLLSGGEKALTALALLIAIFRYRPSPFCVLDEVDAPLDDANITRFTELLTELSKETQFVVITHNKRTMEIAQTLYGVTMEEPGVSKIVGVDFRRQALAS